MKKNVFYLVLVCMLFSSCQQDDYVGEIRETYQMAFTYKDIKYESSYYFSSDSSLIFTDNSVGDLYYQLMNLPNYAVLIDEGKTIFFDDDSELFSYLDKSKTKSGLLPFPPIGNGIVGCAIHFFSDHYLKGNMIVDSPLFPWNDHNVPVMPNGWDNEVNGIRLIGGNEYGGVLTLYSDKNYGGPSMTMTVKPRETSAADLHIGADGNRYPLRINTISSYKLKSIPR